MDNASTTPPVGEPSPAPPPATTATPATTAPSSEPAPVVRAVLQRSYGSAAVMQLGEIPRPVPRSGEVLVQVHAAGIDRGTWHIMRGLPLVARAGLGLRAPKRIVPGLDVAGVVVGTGSAVARFRPGDEVFGIAAGSFAELAVAREAKLAPKPSTLTFEQAAAVPVSGITAWQGLVDVGRLEAGQRVLIVGASGGVGTFAVQIAKALGAHVAGVCSTGKVDLVRSLGADQVLDYTTDDFAATGQRYDLIFDIGGCSKLSRLRRALTPRGTLVIVGGEGGGAWLSGIDRQLRAVALSPFVRQRLTMFVSKERHEDLERLAELIERGQVVPAIDRTYRLDEIKTAMGELEAGRVRGKLVLVP